MLRQLLFAPCALLLASSALADDVVASRTLRIGDVLTISDLRLADKVDDRQVAAMIGKEVRRVVYVGRPVDAADLGPQTLVNRNDVVVMTYSVGGLRMRTEGRALGRGGAGEVIDVMTLSSRQKIRAVVVAPGQVQVRR